jgi:hypothetical protein
MRTSGEKKKKLQTKTKIQWTLRFVFHRSTGLMQVKLTQYRELHYLFEAGDESNRMSSDSAAVCHLKMFEHSYHLPHAMEQLYRCYSYWHVNSSKSPVLIIPGHKKFLRRLMRTPFVQGFVSCLQEMIGLQVLDYRNVSSFSDLPPMVLPRIPKNMHNPNNTFALQDPTCPYYALHSVADARDLRDGVLSHLSLQGRHLSCQKTPNIAILNRKGDRELLNADLIVNTLKEQLPEIMTDNGRNISLTYFEDATFAEQVEFFSSADILISPHGAQLTGLPFMPNCGTVLEIFPKGYYHPFYFGSLAAASGLNHNFISMTKKGDWRNEAARTMQTFKARKHAKREKMCPTTDAVVGVVKQLISQWQDCCAEFQVTN